MGDLLPAMVRMKLTDWFLKKKSGTFKKTGRLHQVETYEARHGYVNLRMNVTLKKTRGGRESTLKKQYMVEAIFNEWTLKEEKERQELKDSKR